MLISFHMEVSLFTDDEAYIDGRKMAGSFKLSQMYSENNTGWESGPDGWKVLTRGTATKPAPTTPAQPEAMSHDRLPLSFSWSAAWSLMEILEKALNISVNLGF